MSLTRIVIAALAGVLVGLFVTIHSLDRSAIGVSFGPWRGASRDKSGEINPYALAATARDGLLPLGSTEGLSFIADTDSKGAQLSPFCDYRVKGPMPQSRFWTLSLLTPEGFPIANPADRYGFTSAEVLRLADQPVTITVSASAKGGNWLPADRSKSFVLMLRLYDTGLSIVGEDMERASLPSIEKVTCP